MYYKSPTLVSKIDWRLRFAQFIQNLGDDRSYHSHLTELRNQTLYHDRITYLQYMIMDRFPIWNKELNPNRPEGLPEDCNWENGVDSFEIESLNEETGEATLVVNSIVSYQSGRGGMMVTASRLEHFELPSNLSGYILPPADSWLEAAEDVSVKHLGIVEAVTEEDQSSYGEDGLPDVGGQDIEEFVQMLEAEASSVGDAEDEDSSILVKVDIEVTSKLAVIRSVIKTESIDELEEEFTSLCIDADKMEDEEIISKVLESHRLPFAHKDPETKSSDYATVTRITPRSLNLFPSEPIQFKVLPDSGVAFRRLQPHELLDRRASGGDVFVSNDDGHTVAIGGYMEEGLKPVSYLTNIPVYRDASFWVPIRNTDNLVESAFLECLVLALNTGWDEVVVSPDQWSTISKIDGYDPISCAFVLNQEGQIGRLMLTPL